MNKIGLGGGCHWCTEAVFTALNGVYNVKQGYISSFGNATDFSEAIIISYTPSIISLETIIEIHLRTHKSSSNHSFRATYRSAVYCFDEFQIPEITMIIENLQLKFEDSLITKALFFNSFKPSRDELKGYYFKNPEKPFCSKYIDPKLTLLLTNFSEHISAKAKAIVVAKTTKQ